MTEVDEENKDHVNMDEQVIQNTDNNQDDNKNNNESTANSDDKKEDDSSPKVEKELTEEDKIWNAYLDKYDHEPKTSQQLQNFANNRDFKTISFKAFQQVFDERQGKGRIKK